MITFEDFRQTFHEVRDQILSASDVFDKDKMSELKRRCPWIEPAILARWLSDSNTQAVNRTDLLANEYLDGMSRETIPLIDSWLDNLNCLATNFRDKYIRIYNPAEATSP